MSGRRMVRGRFVLPVKVEAVDEAHAWRIARALEALLRDRAPSGVDVSAPEVVESHCEEPALHPDASGGEEVLAVVRAWLEAEWAAGRVVKSGGGWTIRA